MPPRQRQHHQNRIRHSEVTRHNQECPQYRNIDIDPKQTFIVNIDGHLNVGRLILMTRKPLLRVMIRDRFAVISVPAVCIQLLNVQRELKKDLTRAVQV